MAGTSEKNNLGQIQQGVKDIERMIGRKEYNNAMMKARQTLERMVKLQAQRACIPDTGDLKSLIDALYESRWINKTTYERYHKIRIIGNKAVHEGDGDPYDANQLHLLLVQEVRTFSGDNRSMQKGTRNPARRVSSSGTIPRGASASPSAGSRISTSRRRRPSARPRRKNDLYPLLVMMIPILSVILLVFVICLLIPEKKEPVPTTTETTMTETTSVPETTIPATDEAEITYRTTTVLNVRSQPNTDGDPVGKLAANTTVNYIKAYDDEWAVIYYNGVEAYVASRYLTTE